MVQHLEGVTIDYMDLGVRSIYSLGSVSFDGNIENIAISAGKINSSYIHDEIFMQHKDEKSHLTSCSGNFNFIEIILSSAYTFINICHQYYLW